MKTVLFVTILIYEYILVISEHQRKLYILKL
jgi:hypothetical protein